MKSFIAKSLILLHCEDIYSVIVVVVGSLVLWYLSVSEFCSHYTKTGDYIGDLYWSPIGF